MPIHHRLKNLLFGSTSGMTRQEAMKVFRRDHFTCQYCGLDGQNNFSNWLVLTIDHIHPRAHGGHRKMDNLVTACRPCNLMKGTHVFSSMEAAKKYVLTRREDWRRRFEEETKAAAA